MNIIKTTLFALATLASIGASAQKSNWQLFGTKNLMKTAN